MSAKRRTLNRLSKGAELEAKIAAPISPPPRQKRRKVDDETIHTPPSDSTIKTEEEQTSQVVAVKEPKTSSVAKAVVKKEKVKHTLKTENQEVIETVTKQSVSATVSDKVVKAKVERKTSVKVKKEVKKEEDSEEDRTDSEAEREYIKTQGKKKTNTKKEKEGDKMPLAARTTGLAVNIGAHVSIAKGVQNSVTNSLKIGGNAFALFLKSQRKWTNPPLNLENAKEFKQLCEKHDYNAMKHVVPHGSYLVNLAQFDKEKAKQAYDCFIEDLQRCEKLGIGLYNFHPGSTLGEPRDKALERVADALNRAHKETKFVRILIENMAGHGNIIGGPWEDLRDIIANVKDKKRVGVCLDTCHAFAAGHDLRTPASFAAVMADFDRIIGLKYLGALHLNDSKAPLGSNRDLHQNIGLGFLGLSTFRNVVNSPAMKGIPMILETPLEKDDVSTWAEEIKLLESLVGMSEDDPKFLELEKALAKKGEKARAEAMVAYEKKMKKKASPKKPKAAIKTNGKITDFVKKPVAKKGKKAASTPPETESEAESSGCDSC